MLQFQSTRPLRGATAWRKAQARRTGNFNPRAPCGARLSASRRLLPASAGISIHAPLAGRDGSTQTTGGSRYISIHAPLAGRDDSGSIVLGGKVNIISIHAPLAGRDEAAVLYLFRQSAFQSTRPLRGATVCRVSHCGWICYFNPRAPCGARPALVQMRTRHVFEFQSTRPLRGATRQPA